MYTVAYPEGSRPKYFLDTIIEIRPMGNKRASRTFFLRRGAS
jgi:hypothetical protein